ncbi:MAG: helix-turn-helix domain-containing protein [Planctomycetota bacterium]
MTKSEEAWITHRAVLEATRELRFTVTHADYGIIPTFGGKDRLFSNRFYFCLEDCGRVLWPSGRGEGGELPLGAGSLTFMPGGTDLTYDFTSGRMAAIHFNLEIFPGLDIFVGETACRQIGGQWALCRKVLHSLGAGMQLSDTLRVHSLLFQAAADFCQDDLEVLRRQVRLREKYAGLLAIVEDRLDASLSVGELAEALGLTRDKLSKAFRRDLGVPLKHYLATRLTRKASTLLTTGLNVRETAEELDFSSAFYFSRFFRTQTGRTPSAYRKEYRV